MARCGETVTFRTVGSSALAEAIQTGMVSGTALQICQRVVDEDRALRKRIGQIQAENARLKEMLRMMEHDRRLLRRDRVEAYRMVLAREGEHQRARDWRATVCVSLVALGAVGMSLITTLVLL